MRPPLELQRCRRNRGFTLIELLITIAIVGVLTSVALPSLRSYITAQKIKSASFDMMSMLMLTRSEAIKRNATVTAAPVNNNWVNGWTITTAGGTVLSSQSAMSGLSITCSASVTCNNIAFTNNGRSSSTQTIEIHSTSADGKRCIGLDLSGRPNVKKGAC